MGDGHSDIGAIPEAMVMATSERVRRRVSQTQSVCSEQQRASQEHLLCAQSESFFGQAVMCPRLHKFAAPEVWVACMNILLFEITVL